VSFEEAAKLEASLEEMAKLDLGGDPDVKAIGLSLSKVGDRVAYVKHLKSKRIKMVPLGDGEILGALGLSRLKLDDTVAASRWLGDFTRHDAVTAKSIRTMRVLLAKDDRASQTGTKLIYRDLQASLMKAELTKQDGFVKAQDLLSVAKALTPQEGGRASFGPEPGAAYLPGGFFVGLARQFVSVVRIYLAVPYRELGTGFFVRASDVIKGESDRPVVITCHHVVPAANEELKLGLIKAESEYNRALHISRFTSILKYSNGPLDYCILDPHIPNGAPVPFFVDEAAIPDPLGPNEASSAPRVVQFGHPKGGALTASNAANRMIAKDQVALHYQASSMPGTSGGPVCDLNFNVVALHTGSGPIPSPLHPHTSPYSAGQGTRLSAIKSDVGA